MAEFLNVKEDFPQETIDELTKQLEKIEIPENTEPKKTGSQPENEKDDRKPEDQGPNEEWSEKLLSSKTVTRLHLYCLIAE